MSDSKYRFKIFSNINLYLILFLISISFIVMLLRINGILSSNKIIYIIIILIIIFSSIFYAINIRGLSDNKGLNGYVSSSNKNVNINQLVRKYRENNKKSQIEYKKAQQGKLAENKFKQEFKKSQEKRVQEKKRQELVKKQQELIMKQESNKKMIQRKAREIARIKENKKIPKIRTNITPKTTENNRKTNKINLESLLNAILRDLNSDPNDEKLGIIKGKILKFIKITNQEGEKEYQKHALSLIRSKYSKYAPYILD
jgi:low affinity Fe/Cu permease